MSVFQRSSKRDVRESYEADGEGKRPLRRDLSIRGTTGESELGRRRGRGRKGRRGEPFTVEVGGPKSRSLEPQHTCLRSKGLGMPRTRPGSTVVEADLQGEVEE